MASRGTTKFKSNKQEKLVAKELCGKTVIASGSLWGSKGDVRADDFLVECKTTEKTFYSLTENVWSKIEKEAVKDGLRIPVMCIDLEDGKCRVAVFKYNALHIENSLLGKVATTCKSVRVRSNDILPYTISLDGVRLPNGKPLRLVVTSWEHFLEISERSRIYEA